MADTGLDVISLTSPNSKSLSIKLKMVTQSDLKKVQEISYEILLDIRSVCERHKIEYFLVYGTLIGAIRHKGFIPWDCDIDIAMTRENYMRFIEVADELSPENEMWIMGSGSPKWLSELKIGRKGTLFCLEDAKELNIMNQISVDIFLVDRIKDLSEWKRILFGRIKKILMLSKLNWDEKRLIFKMISRSKYRCKSLLKIAFASSHLLRVLLTEEGIEYLIYKMYVDEVGKSTYYSVVQTDGRKWPADFQLIEAAFENSRFPIPSCYDEILTNQYGDYMTPPKEEDRAVHNMSDWIVEVV